MTDKMIIPFYQIKSIMILNQLLDYNMIITIKNLQDIQYNNHDLNSIIYFMHSKVRDMLCKV